MASSSSNNINEIKEVSGSYNLATEFKIHVNNQITQKKGCLKRYVEERNELQKKVEASQDPINVSHRLGPFKNKRGAIIGCLLETQKRERNRIILLTALINDISDGIREKERQAKLMEVHEQVSSDED
ncbi:hypothetical protein CTI12_AA297980 [Artemisia annua]|uniref:Uncharacterized protein n=1 Tax=Artemisia annua TaxID=35608 RepID=A0A2U1N7I7_ARTAN|nr:hypothetical protein CTI12_AA297980 [Artemisia annua]